MGKIASPILEVAMVDAETVTAISEALHSFGFSKWHVFGGAILLGIIYNGKHILAHIQNIMSIKNNFLLEQKKIDAKIEAEREKRKRKSLKGKQ